jgi:hypothetical protein
MSDEDRDQRFDGPETDPDEEGSPSPDDEADEGTVPPEEPAP